jgi:hypothetical protein
MSRLWTGISSTRFLRDKRFFSSPEHQDQLWGPPSLLFNGYKVLSPDIKQRQLTALPWSHAKVLLYLYSSYKPYGMHGDMLQLNISYQAIYSWWKLVLSWHNNHNVSLGWFMLHVSAIQGILISTPSIAMCALCTKLRQEQNILNSSPS